MLGILAELPIGGTIPANSRILVDSRESRQIGQKGLGQILHGSGSTAGLGERKGAESVFINCVALISQPLAVLAGKISLDPVA